MSELPRLTLQSLYTLSPVVSCQTETRMGACPWLHVFLTLADCSWTTSLKRTLSRFRPDVKAYTVRCGGQMYLNVFVKKGILLTHPLICHQRCLLDLLSHTKSHFPSFYSLNCFRETWGLFRNIMESKVYLWCVYTPAKMLSKTQEMTCNPNVTVVHWRTDLFVQCSTLTVLSGHRVNRMC